MAGNLIADASSDAASPPKKKLNKTKESSVYEKKSGVR